MGGRPWRSNWQTQPRYMLALPLEDEKALPGCILFWTGARFAEMLL
jgi:hypothetical protein